MEISIFTYANRIKFSTLHFQCIFVWMLNAFVHYLYWLWFLFFALLIFLHVFVVVVFYWISVFCVGFRNQKQNIIDTNRPKRSRDRLVSTKFLISFHTLQLCSILIFFFVFSFSCSYFVQLCRIEPYFSDYSVYRILNSFSKT